MNGINTLIIRRTKAVKKGNDNPIENPKIQIDYRGKRCNNFSAFIQWYRTGNFKRVNYSTKHTFFSYKGYVTTPLLKFMI